MGRAAGFAAASLALALLARIPAAAQDDPVLATGADGAARTRAFFGTYRIVVTHDGKTVSREILHDRKGRSTQVEVVLE